MRTIRYYVVNKETKTAIYTNCNHHKCVEFMETLENKEQYAIGHKWLSI